MSPLSFPHRWYPGYCRAGIMAEITVCFLALLILMVPASAGTAQPEGAQEYDYCKTGICAMGLEASFPFAVNELSVYDGDLVAGGYFSAADGVPVKHLAFWDGYNWHDLGGGIGGLWSNAVFALAEYNGDLIVAGKFGQAGDTPANNIAAWDGNSWQPLGDGIKGPFATIYDLCVYDGLLVAAGNFDSAGTVAVNDLAAWNGSEWIDLPGLSADNGMSIDALCLYDGKLIAGGNFNFPPGRIAAWDGNSWTGLNAGIIGNPSKMTVFDNKLIVGGDFHSAGGQHVNGITAYDGANWLPLDSGVYDSAHHYATLVSGLTVYDGRLIAGGRFNRAGEVDANNVAAWDGTSWSSLGDGMGDLIEPFVSEVQSLAVYDSSIIAGGKFIKYLGAPGNRIAYWDGSTWDEVTADSGMPFAFEIDRIVPYGGIPHGEQVSVAVKKVGGTEEMYGFDLLIGYDPNVLTALEATPGPIFDIPGEYEWDYFAYRFVDIPEGGGDVPYMALRLVGIANINDGSPPALQNNIPDGTVLGYLEMKVTINQNINCTWSPLRFLWADCGDNSIALENGDIVVSDGVYQNDYGTWENIADPTGEFPTLGGAPDTCLNLGQVNPDRFVDFINGGVFVFCDTTQIDYRGDINLNGISNEIADWVMFTNYFFNDTAAFGGHVEASMAASDINADGLVLRLNDLVYLMRIIIGDGLPYPLEGTNKYATIVQDFESRTVSVEADDTLAAVFMIFDGEIVPDFLVDTSEINCGYEYDGEYTRILIQPNSQRLGFLQGPLFTYTGEGILLKLDDPYNSYPLYPDIYLSPQVADFENNYFQVEVEYVYIRGDLNANLVPYETADAIVFANYFIEGMTAFGDHVLPSTEASDVNYDGNTLQLEDYLYLIRVITGDAVAYDEPQTPISAGATFTQDGNTQTVAISDIDSVASVFMVFDGTIVPTFQVNPASATWMYNHVDGRTRILLHPDISAEMLPALNNDVLLGYSGNGVLIEAHAADHHDRVYATDINLVDIAFCGDINGDYRVNVGDAVYIMVYLFREGPPPVNPDMADLNGDQEIDVSDAVYLINYVFRDGEPPDCPTP